MWKVLVLIKGLERYSLGFKSLQFSFCDLSNLHVIQEMQFEIAIKFTII